MAAVRDVKLVLSVKLYVAVYACALIPPALSLKALDIYRKNVGTTVEVSAVGYVEYSLGVCAEGARHKRAVEVELSVYCRSLKNEYKLLVRKRGIEQEGLAVPSVVSRTIAVRDKVFFSEIALREIIVREIHHAPISVVPLLSACANNRACLTSGVGRGMAVSLVGIYVAEVELPLSVHIKNNSCHIIPP